MNQIKINFDFHYPLPILWALESVAKRLMFDIVIDKNIPVNSFFVNGIPVGYVVYEDAMHFNDHHIINMNAHNYQKIFKFHYSPNVIDYSKLPIHTKYLNRSVPCGLWRYWESQPGYIGWDKEDLLTRDRDIDVMSTMRCTNSGTPADPALWPAWATIRKDLMQQTHEMRLAGYKTVYEMKPREVYANSLKDTKLGFIWSASSYLGWKIPEFIQEGVIMITEPLGNDYPLLNGVVLEDGIHCIFEKNPKNFSDVAKELLKDTATMQTIKTNVLDLWETKMSKDKAGEWYYNQLMEGYMQTK